MSGGLAFTCDEVLKEQEVLTRYEVESRKGKREDNNQRMFAIATRPPFTCREDRKVTYEEGKWN